MRISVKEEGTARVLGMGWSFYITKLVDREGGRGTHFSLLRETPEE